MIDKIRSSDLEMLAEIEDGSSIAIGGFGRAGVPRGLCDALCELGKRDLHVIANNAGIDDRAIGRLVKEGRVRKVSASFPANPEFFRQFKAGQVELELVPQGTLAERMRAAGAGIPAFYTPTSFGTDLAMGTYGSRYDEDGNVLEYMPAKDVRVINGKPCVLEFAFDIDYALVRARRADRLGNLEFRLSAFNFNVPAAMGAKKAFVEVQEIVEVGEIDPEHVHLPGIFVHSVALAREIREEGAA